MGERIEDLGGWRESRWTGPRGGSRFTAVARPGGEDLATRAPVFARLESLTTWDRVGRQIRVMSSGGACAARLETCDAGRGFGLVGVEA